MAAPLPFRKGAAGLKLSDLAQSAVRGHSRKGDEMSSLQPTGVQDPTSSASVTVTA